MSYALEKLGLAVYELTIGEGNIKSRLRSAIRYLSAVYEKDFPEELRKDWRSIKKRLTKRESKYKNTQFDEGRFEATIFPMHKKTGSKIAADIVDLHSRLDGFIKDGYKNP